MFKEGLGSTPQTPSGTGAGDGAGAGAGQGRAGQGRAGSSEGKQGKRLVQHWVTQLVAQAKGEVGP